MSSDRSQCWCGPAGPSRNGAPRLGLVAHAFVACKRAPSVELVRFLEDQDHLVLWVHDAQVDFGRRTRLRWQSGLRDDTALARHG
jgi:hypothetical protein